MIFIFSILCDLLDDLITNKKEKIEDDTDSAAEEKNQENKPLLTDKL